MLHTRQEKLRWIVRAAPWRGVLVANALPFTDDLEIDFDRHAQHVAWLAESGCDGITPNGSLGEYQTLTDSERARVVETAMAAAPGGFAVIPGVGAYGSREAVRWTEHAAEAGAPAVMSLPPNAYRADERSIFDHFRAVAAVGLPVIAYNNPIDTKVDLTPELLARLYGEGLIVAVKEFAGDPRRAYALAELAPELDLLVGSDDTLLETVLAGARGWVSGYPNVFPRSCLELYRAAMEQDVKKAVPLYRQLHALLRWDSKPEFVQAVKFSMDLAGRYGGPCRPPRVPLADEHRSVIRELTDKAIAEGMT
jgi:dihydrodipicolinate synthase/N-acetylneuraminate lyase